MQTFQVDDVKMSNKRLPDSPMAVAYLQELARAKVEGFGYDGFSPLAIKNFHPFVQALWLAYDNHLPLMLRPDDIWTLIAQGLAQHINNNAETLRSRFVDHEGQMHIVVDDDNLRKGAPDNDWLPAIGQLSDAIKEHIGKQHALFLNDFTTSTAITRAASEVVLMDAMQAYFTYGVRTMCGIPSVTLLGTPGDWERIRTRARVLGEYGDLGWWIEPLDEVLYHFEQAAQGNVERSFWKNIFKESGGSGGPYISGWVNVLFPYLKDWRTKTVSFKSPQLDWRKPKGMGGTTSDSFPSGVSAVPFKWEYYTKKFDMQFLGGFVGVGQDKTTRIVAPLIGFGVADAPNTDNMAKEWGA